MAKQCEYNDCTNPVFGGKMCSWHQFARQDRKPASLQKNATSIKSNGVRINPLSAKREKQNQEYNRLAKQFKIDHPFCEARLEGCQLTTTEVHHAKGRIGLLLTDTTHFKALCSACHKRCENEPLMAKELGLSVSRLKK